MAILKDLIVQGVTRLLGDTNAAKVTATSFVKSGGTSSQFLKADGTVDSNTYATQTWVNNKGYTTNTGTVTSVGLTVPTGLSVSGSPITTSGTLAISLASGYSIPTTTKQGQWDTAYTNNHTHSNKSVLDGISSTNVTNWGTAYSHATDASRLTTAKSSGFYKFATTAEGHIASVTAVTASDLTTLIGSTTYAPYNANGYLPLTGGTLYKSDAIAPLAIKGKYDSSNNRSFLAFQLCSNSSGDVGATGLIGINSDVQPIWAVPRSGTSGLDEHNILHSGNSSVSLSGSTLTVKINGTSKSLTNTNTTYSAGTGLSLSSTTFNHSNSVTAQTTQAVYPIKIDAQGHISAYGSAINYAGSSSAGGAATSANKLNTNAGSATNPVYFSGGVPVACTYSLNKTVPSDAVFTDTNNAVTQTATTTSAAYEVLFSATADNTTRTEGARKTSTLTYNPSTKALSTGGTVNGLTLSAQTTGFKISGGTTSKTLTVGADYTLGAACAKGVTDNSSATAVTSSDTNLITGRTLYYAGYVKSSGVTGISWDSTNNVLAWKKDGVAQTGITIGFAQGASTAGYATAAAQDESGNNIKATYAASFSISDHTITLKNKNGESLGTVTVPDNNTWTAMVGATSSANGSVGYVNAVPPKDGYNTKFLRADGSWSVPAYPDISGKADKTDAIGTVAWDSNNSQIIYSPISGSGGTVVSASTLKTAMSLNNVGNFKAVSTVANQGLTSTEKSNARANIGAGTSSLTLGTSATTAAYGNHNHSGVYADGLAFSDSGTNAVSMLLMANGTTKDAMTITGGTNKITVNVGESSKDITITPSISNNVTGSGTSGYLAKFNGTNTITNGPALGSGTTTYLRNDGSWATPTNTTYKFTIGSTTKGDSTNGVDLGTLKSEAAASGGTTLSLVTTGEKNTWNNKTSNTGTVTSVTISAGTGISVSSSSAITTSGTRTISLNSTYQGYISHGESAYNMIEEGDIYQFAISSNSNKSSITLPANHSYMYYTCSNTSYLTLNLVINASGNVLVNAENYILIRNTTSSAMTVNIKSNASNTSVIAPSSSFTIPAGTSMEVSYIKLLDTNANVETWVFTFGSEMTAFTATVQS